MDRRSLLAALAAGASVGLAGCGIGGGSPSTGDYDVGMGASSFTPQEVTVSVGEAVIWRNTNSRAHTVTAYESALPEGAPFFATGGFETEQAARDSFYEGFEGALSTGDTYTHTFTVAGTHRYFCIPHERAGMVGAVVVEP